MKILITGASGYIGKNTALRLLSDNTIDNSSIICTGRDKSRLEELARNGGVILVGSLQDECFVNSLLEGVDTVIHCAGLTGWEPESMENYLQANVDVTKTLLAACQKNQVKRFINIGTPSVYFDFTDIKNRDENYAAKRKLDSYSETKLMAERLVIDAHSPSFQTVSLRPRFVTGEGDSVFLPKMIRMHQNGELKQIGGGQNYVDFTSIENVVDAIELCLNAEADVMGEIYNITNGEPVLLWSTLNGLFSKLNQQPVTKKVPYWLAFCVGGLLELIQPQPKISRYSVSVMAKTMTLDIDKARKNLGYAPRQNTQQMIDAFVAHYGH